MMLNLPIEELKTLRRLQHSKEFEHYWAQITCILMLAHGHDAKTVAYDLGISLSSVYNYVDSYKSGGISKLTDNTTRAIGDFLTVRKLPPYVQNFVVRYTPMPKVLPSR